MKTAYRDTGMKNYSGDRIKAMRTMVLAFGVAAMTASATPAAAFVGQPGAIAAVPETVGVARTEVRFLGHGFGRRGFGRRGFGGRRFGRGFGRRGFRGGYGGYGYGGGGGAAIGAGIAGLAAGALIGGAIANANHGSAVGNSVAYCENKFKSYDPARGSYLGYDGQRHACP